MLYLARRLGFIGLLGVVCLGGMVWGCGGAIVNTNESMSSKRTETSRKMSGDATWQDIVNVLLARGLGDEPQGETKSCILEGFAGGADGTLQIPAVTPSTEEPILMADEWWESMHEQQTDLLTPWGTYNAANSDAMLYPLTPLTRELLDEPLIPIILIEENQERFGALFSNELWFEKQQSPKPQTPWSVLTATYWELLQMSLFPGVPSVLVTAKRNVSIQRIREVLEKLQGTVNRVTLVVAVQTTPDFGGATLPLAHRVSQRVPPEDKDLFCPADAKAVPSKRIPGRTPGWFNYDGSTDMHEEFQTMVYRECGAELSEHESGLMHLVVRIDKEGKPEHVCILKDTVENASFRKCALKQVEKFPFPTLTRGDYLQLHLASFFFGSTIQPLCK